MGYRTPSAMGASGRSDPEEWRSRLPERRRSSGMCGSAGDPVAERRRIAGEVPCCVGRRHASRAEDQEQGVAWATGWTLASLHSPHVRLRLAGRQHGPAVAKTNNEHLCRVWRGAGRAHRPG